MACTKVQLLILLNKIRKELKCKKDKSILDIYIEHLESVSEAEIESELWGTLGSLPFPLPQLPAHSQPLRLFLSPLRELRGLSSFIENKALYGGFSDKCYVVAPSTSFSTSVLYPFL